MTPEGSIFDCFLNTERTHLLVVQLFAWSLSSDMPAVQHYQVPFFKGWTFLFLAIVPLSHSDLGLNDVAFQLFPYILLYLDLDFALWVLVLDLPYWFKGLFWFESEISIEGTHFGCF